VKISEPTSVFGVNFNKLLIILSEMFSKNSVIYYNNLNETQLTIKTLLFSSYDFFANL